jgi:hypothetical protein
LETKDVLTLVGLIISLGGLVISLVKLAQEQHKANKLKEKEIDAQLKVEKRTEYKLRIYQALIDERLNIDGLVSKFREHTPLSEVDQVELRKCIYEMLVEETLVAYEDKTYSSNTTGEDEGNEDGEEDEGYDDEEEDEDQDEDEEAEQE